MEAWRVLNSIEAMGGRSTPTLAPSHKGEGDDGYRRRGTEGGDERAEAAGMLRSLYPAIFPSASSITALNKAGRWTGAKCVTPSIIRNSAPGMISAR